MNPPWWVWVLVGLVLVLLVFALTGNQVQVHTA